MRFGRGEGQRVQTTAETGPGEAHARPPQTEAARLQGSLGNRIVAQMSGPVVQASLVLGPVGDAAEREADHAAAAAGAGLRAPPIRGRPGRGLAVGDAFTAGVERLRGSGEPLAGDVRAEMESRLGGEFGAVRVHTGPGPAALAREVGARAFTRGQDIFFAGGRYEPRTPAGRSLLAHELTHTLQQGCDASSIQRDPEDGVIVQDRTGVHKSNHKAVTSGTADVLAVGTGIKHRLAKGAKVTVDFASLDPTGKYVLVTYLDGTETKTGYVHRDKVQPAEFDEPALFAHPAATGQGLTYEYQDRSEVALFHDDVDVEHVRQGMLGDCYFVSAVASLVQRDPTSITKMMEDRGDHVRVRFYRGGTKPEYVHVKKTVPGFAGGGSYQLGSGGRLTQPYAQGALWMTLLEKAYAAFRGVSYEGLQAGTAVDVWGHMLGARTSSEAVFGDSSGTLPWLVETRKERRDQELGRKQALIAEIFGNDEDKVSRWTAFIKKSASIRDDSIEGARQSLTARGAPGDLMDAVIGYLARDKIMSGYSGSGVYSRPDIALWEKIRKLVVDDKEAVAAGTPNAYGAASHKEGIHAEHSYTVIGASQTDGLYYLKLRNPWGKGGISYEREEIDSYGSKSALRAREDHTHGGVFDIELSHFIATFETLYTTQGAQEL